jgi:hypothetical protein
MRSDGLLWVDKNTQAVYSLIVRTNYDGTDYDSGAFTISLVCPAVTTVNVTLTA